MKLDDGFGELDQATFERVRDRELRPEYGLTGLRLLREKAVRERDLREIHRTEHRWGRAPYELLQNADDVGAKHAVFILSRDGLGFAHDGRWFTVDNFRGLAEGWSDKTPGECIGHKGLGFRSVLDITAAPHFFRVARNSFFGVKFTWAVNKNYIEENLRRNPRNPELRRFHDDLLKQGQPYCPIMAIPATAKKASAGSGITILDRCAAGRYAPNLTTLFWFPATDPDLPPAVLRELGPRPIIADDDSRKLLFEFVTRDLASILPFLGSLETVLVFEGEEMLCAARAQGKAANTPSEITVLIENSHAVIAKETFFILRDSFVIPIDVKAQAETPVAVKRMDRAKVALAVRLDPHPIHEATSSFHVYFPTEERTGVGFTVHGDFHVKPDRTRLIPGSYNQWLFERIARLCATRFFDELLARYQAGKVYEALAPIGSAEGMASRFVTLLGDELRRRTKPFVATTAGLLNGSEAALPAVVDREGFWAKHFAGALARALRAKKAFLRPSEDGPTARLFFRLAGVNPLSSETFLDLLEAAGENERSPEWWYECYNFLAEDPKLSRQGHDAFAGRRILLTGSGPMAVPESTDTIVSLPPTGAEKDLSLPRLFSQSFLLLNAKLAELLRSGPDSVEAWILTRFKLARFEATDLVPRAVRRVAPDIFHGRLKPSPEEVAEAWIFIRAAVALSRRIESSEFWQEVGRFPIIAGAQGEGTGDFVPAFLAYWPDSLLPSSSPLFGVGGLRRIEPSFFALLQGAGGSSADEWRDFLERAGVSDKPKLLRFARIATEESSAVNEKGKIVSSAHPFRGERQADENTAVLSALDGRELWAEKPSFSCTHRAECVLQSLRWLDGFLGSVTKAIDQYRQENSEWQERLWRLVRSLPFADPHALGDDALLCKGTGPQGHAISIPSQVQRQLTTSHWLPSSVGPVPLGVAFARLSTRRLIRTGASGEELGDALLPYVVARDAAELERLRQLGVDVLDDAPSASPEALTRALRMLGESLDSSTGREKVLAQPARKRLVRGAIQEIYRALNQSSQGLDLSRVKLPIRTTAGVDLSTGPFYFAEPGSPLERGFIDRLPLIDVDRPYPRFFDALGVTRLVIGETVDENLLDADHALPIETLKNEIMEKVAPFLLALVLVRGEPDRARLIVRRLTERFDILAMPRLRVSLALKADPTVRVDSEFANSYLRKRLESGHGAIEEAHFSLYLEAPPAVSICSLDGDALGDALGRIFLDGANDELLGLFSRVLTRYQTHSGDQTAVERFLLDQLGVSREAQEEARALLRGEEAVGRSETPPPAVVVAPAARQEAQNGETITRALTAHEQEIAAQTRSFVEDLLHGGARPRVSQSDKNSAASGERARGQSITPEQQLRGRLGEEEIMRRLKLPGGWEGFRFLEDHRELRCGYDFLASLAEQSVKLEVKTFSPGGQVVVTEGELRQAAASRSSYFLIGALDDGGPPHSWKTVIVQDPLEILLREGRFSTNPELRLKSESLFNTEGS